MPESRAPIRGLLTPLNPLGPWGFITLGGLALYYTLQAAVRVVTGEACQLDEAEQILLSQEWHWGYGSQGPLYTWLLRLIPLPADFHIGRLALLKNLLLLGTHVFVYLLARRILRNEPAAVTAALSLFLIPGFVYESQRDQSHLVLATCLGAAVVWALSRVVTEGRPLDHVLLGVLSAGAVLSKYNTLVLLVGAALAVALSPSARHAFRTPWAFAGLAVFTIALTPHLFWAWTHPERLASQSYKLGFDAIQDPLTARAATVGRWLVCLGAYATVPAIFLALLRRPAPPCGQGPDHHLARLVGSILASTLALSALAAIAAGAVSLKPRWFQPVMVLLPVWAAALWFSSIRSGGWRRLSVASIIAAFAGCVGVHGPVWGASVLGRPNNLNVRYDLLAYQLREDGFDRGLIVSDDRRLAGNLLGRLSGSVAVVPTLDFFQVPADTAAVIVWDAAKGHNLPRSLRRFAAAWIRDWPCHQPSGVAEAPGLRGDPRVTRLVYVLVPSHQVASAFSRPRESFPGQPTFPGPHSPVPAAIADAPWAKAAASIRTWVSFAAPRASPAS